jgi:hypothetical protein
MCHLNLGNLLTRWHVKHVCQVFFYFFIFYFSVPILLGQFNLVMDLSFFFLIPNFFY